MMNNQLIIQIICTIFLYFNSSNGQQTSTHVPRNCGTKDFICSDSKNFLLCFDLTATGRMETIDDYEEQCPIGTYCDNNDLYKCNSTEEPTTLSSLPVFPLLNTISGLPEIQTNLPSTPELSEYNTPTNPTNQFRLPVTDEPANLTIGTELIVINNPLSSANNTILPTTDIPSINVNSNLSQSMTGIPENQTIVLDILVTKSPLNIANAMEFMSSNASTTANSSPEIFGTELPRTTTNAITPETIEPKKRITTLESTNLVDAVEFVATDLPTNAPGLLSIDTSAVPFYVPEFLGTGAIVVSTNTQDLPTTFVATNLTDFSEFITTLIPTTTKSITHITKTDSTNSLNNSVEWQPPIIPTSYTYTPLLQTTNEPVNLINSSEFPATNSLDIGMNGLKFPPTETPENITYTSGLLVVETTFSSTEGSELSDTHTPEARPSATRLPLANASSRPETNSPRNHTIGPKFPTIVASSISPIATESLVTDENANFTNFSELLTSETLSKLTPDFPKTGIPTNSTAVFELELTNFSIYSESASELLVTTIPTNPTRTSGSPDTENTLNTANTPELVETVFMPDVPEFPVTQAQINSNFTTGYESTNVAQNVTNGSGLSTTEGLSNTTNNPLLLVTDKLLNTTSKLQVNDRPAFPTIQFTSTGTLTTQPLTNPITSHQELPTTRFPLTPSSGYPTNNHIFTEIDKPVNPSSDFEMSFTDAPEYSTTSRELSGTNPTKAFSLRTTEGTSDQATDGLANSNNTLEAIPDSSGNLNNSSEFSFTDLPSNPINTPGLPTIEVTTIVSNATATTNSKNIGTDTTRNSVYIPELTPNIQIQSTYATNFPATYAPANLTNVPGSATTELPTINSGFPETTDTASSSSEFSTDLSLNQSDKTSETDKLISSAINLSTTLPPTEQPIFQCKTSGKFSHPSDCQRYYICVNIPFVGLRGWELICSTGLSFDSTNLRCTSDVLSCGQRDFECKDTGRFPDPLFNNRYYICLWSLLGGIQKYNIVCPSGTIYIPEGKTCHKPNIMSFNSNGTNSIKIIEKSISESNEVNNNKGIQSDESQEKSTEKIESDVSIEKSYKSKSDEDVRKDNSSTEKVKFECENEGYSLDPNNERKYYLCNYIPGKKKFKKTHLKCAKYFRFDFITESCVQN